MLWLFFSFAFVISQGQLFVSTWRIIADPLPTNPIVQPFPSTAEAQAPVSISLPIRGIANVSISSNAIGTRTQTVVNGNATFSDLFPGLFNVEISGNFSFGTFDRKDATKLATIVTWGGFFMDRVSENMFAGCINLVSVPGTQPRFEPQATLKGMFWKTSLNSSLDWDLTNVVSLVSMFEETPFNSRVSFRSMQGVQDMSRMFYNATSFNQPLILDTTNVVSMRQMFCFAIAFNSPLNFTSTANVVNMMNMFSGATVFNQPLNFNTSKVTDMSYMFARSRFNQPLAFDTRQVTTFRNIFWLNRYYNQSINFTTTTALTIVISMFDGATRFNSPVYMSNTSNVTSYMNMFNGASVFNQPVDGLDTQNAINLEGMFEDCSKFNQSVNFQTGNVVKMSSMFAGATVFNQPIAFKTDNVTEMDFMFQATRAFNQPLSFNTSKVTTMTGMFRASAYNQPINFDTRSVREMGMMFANATAFNSALNFTATPQLLVTQQMFSGATSFNQPVNLDTQNVINMAWMFQNTAAFTRAVTFNTSQVVDMTGMFSNVSGFTQNLSRWDVRNVVSCYYLNFCEQCILPNFTACIPCRRVFSSRGPMCVCPLNETCVLDLCTWFDTTLRVECISDKPVGPPSPTPLGGPRIISPIYNITDEDENGTNSSFVFTIPREVVIERGTVSQSCFGEEITCEWQDPSSMMFQKSGCAVSNANVDLGSGVVGTECTCSHLTVFAIALRTEYQLAPLCQASSVDYALIALYSALAVVLCVQIARGVFHALATVSIVQHILLLLACILRVVYLVAKPLISSLAGLVFLGLLPSVIALSLFIHVLVVWASVQMFSMQSSPFTKLRLPFIVVTSCVFLLTLVIVVAVAATEGNTQMQIEIVRDGSYVLAALYALVCVLVLLAGSGMTRTLASPTLPSFDWRSAVRLRVTVVTVGLSACLLTGACLWVAAVQTDIIDSLAGTLATTTCFYAVDWLSFCVIAWLFAQAVSGAVSKSKSTRASSTHHKSHSSLSYT